MASFRWLACTILVTTIFSTHHTPLTALAGAAEGAASITTDAARRIRPGMTVAEVVSNLGPARIDVGSRCLPLLPPCSSLVLKNGPSETDLCWVSGMIAITARVDNKSKRVIQVWHNLPIINP